MEDMVGLEEPFKEEEIKDAIWSCEGSKSLGPDDMSLLFFKKCWSFIKDDVCACFQDFRSGAVLSKSITSSFLTLIPKSSNPMGLDDYRPIFLVGSIHKIFSKLFASRIKKILHNIISPSQTAFVSGRQLVDGVLVAK